MEASPDRRTFVATGAAALAVSSAPASYAVALVRDDADHKEKAYPHYPSQDPDLVRQMVGASHGNIKRVKELLAISPEFALATWDWGFGDWETALGAASHTGRREIARLLIENGARPDIFTFAMLGNLDVVKAYCEAHPGIQRQLGPHGITLLAHARFGREESADVHKYLEELGDADIGHVNHALSDAEKERYVGTYTFGPGKEWEVILMRNKNPGMRLGKDGVARSLMNQGNHVFHPAGAPSVRIVFDLSDDRAIAIRIKDANPEIVARRVG